MNKEKALKRELTRLRKTQNASVIDLRRIRQIRRAKMMFWSLKKRSVRPRVVEEKTKEKTKTREIELEETPVKETVEEDLLEEEQPKEDMPDSSGKTS